MQNERALHAGVSDEERRAQERERLLDTPMSAEEAWRQPEIRAKYEDPSTLRRWRTAAVEAGRLDADTNPPLRWWLAEMKNVQARKGRRRAPRDPGRR